MSPEMINGCLVLQPLCISPMHSCKLVVTSFRVAVLSLTSSSDLMALSFIISWKRSKLLVPIGCSSNSLHRATSWGRSRCSSVSSSSNSLEKRTMSFVWGCSPVPRTWNGKLRTHYYSKASSVIPQTRDSGSVTTLEQRVCCHSPPEHIWRSAAPHRPTLLYSFEPSQRSSPAET